MLNLSVSDKQAVQHNDGLEVVTRDKKWSHVAARLGYQPGKGIASTLRQHYEKLIYPYDIFLLSATPDVKEVMVFFLLIHCSYDVFKSELRFKRQLKPVI